MIKVKKKELAQGLEVKSSRKRKTKKEKKEGKNPSPQLLLLGKPNKSPD